MFDLAERDNVREMPAPARAMRPITDLAKIFGQFAQLQQQFSEQVCALEESVGAQRQQLIAQLPELKKQINWLIRQDEGVRERFAQNEAEIAALNSHWKSTLDQLIELLMKARAETQRHEQSPSATLSA